ncbi:PA2169 family four-helix-bundle protein [Flavobacterium lacustre]|uniref:PA2169 family four-helix-bundle protein n=1 Tax=Flavobacterium lacustre TaxID=3016339 RepID=UPI0022B64CFD|nr:PA2169 family four-helix-bundle protein [Flavobacterium lacustre]
MNTEKSIDVLNNLIEINDERLDGYETASKVTYESDLISLFFEFQEKSQKHKEELIVEIKKLGGKPIKKTKKASRLYKFWNDIKTALVDKDREDILSICEYDDDKTFRSYRTILKDNFDFLNQELLTKLKAQQHAIKLDHDRVKNLRDSILNHESK